MRKYSEELIRQAKKLYLENDFTLKEISDESGRLFGQEIAQRDLEWYSRSDPDGHWSVLKANSGRKTADVPMSEKLALIANKLYDQLVDPESDLTATQFAQLAKTWADLVDKAKLTKEVSTNKVSSQTAKDIFEQVRAELNAN